MNHGDTETTEKCNDEANRSVDCCGQPQPHGSFCMTPVFSVSSVSPWFLS